MSEVSRRSVTPHHLVGIALMLAGLSAQAAPTYMGQIVLDGKGSGLKTDAIRVLVEDSKTVVVGVEQRPLSEGEVMASAGAFGLRALSRSSVFLNGGHMGSSATAAFLFDDLIITNEADPANSAPITFGFNFHLSGKLSLGDIGSEGAGDNNSNVLVRVSFALGASNSLGASAGSICVRTDNTTPCTTTGIFAGEPAPSIINGDFKTPTRRVLVGVPQYLGLSLYVQSGAANLNPTPQEAAADFWNTLDFVAGKPVFDLPAGYTANSVGARIVNNVYQPVPEPYEYALLMGGLAVLGLRVRRRR